jgi:hypothetical protein
LRPHILNDLRLGFAPVDVEAVIPTGGIYIVKQIWNWGRDVPTPARVGFAAGERVALFRERGAFQPRAPAASKGRPTI